MRILTARHRALLLGGLLLAGLLGAAYGVAGYVMAGSLSVAHPERLAHWQHVATIYLGVILSSVALIVGDSVALVRRRRTP
jgi:hypothetical protein